MKKILSLITAVLIGTAPAYAAPGDGAKNLIGLGMKPQWAKQLTGSLKLNGHLEFDTSGKTLKIPDGTTASACMGTATANGTTAVTVSTTCASTGARIFISATSDGTGTSTNDQGACWATNIVNGVSFDLDCPDADNGAAYNWLIIKDES